MSLFNPTICLAALNTFPLPSSASNMSQYLCLSSPWALATYYIPTPHTNDDLAICRRNTVDAGEVHFTRIVWSMPNIIIEPSIKIDINSLIVNNQITLATFRARTSLSISVPEGNAPFQWNLTVPGGTDKPRWIFVGFQTDKCRTQE